MIYYRSNINKIWDVNFSRVFFWKRKKISAKISPQEIESWQETCHNSVEGVLDGKRADWEAEMEKAGDTVG
jgi:hypothetical protein